MTHAPVTRLVGGRNARLRCALLALALAGTAHAQPQPLPSSAAPPGPPRPELKPELKPDLRLESRTPTAQPLLPRNAPATVNTPQPMPAPPPGTTPMPTVPAKLLRPLAPGVVMTPGVVAPADRKSLACGIEFANPCAEATGLASARLRWAPRAEATHYRVLRGSDALATVTADTREYVDNTLAPGTTTTYAIEALRQTGSHTLGGATLRAGVAPGAERTGATLLRFDTLEISTRKSVFTPTLEAPRNVSAQSIAGPKGQVRVSWTPVAGADAYSVVRNGTGAPIEVAAGRHSVDDMQVPLGQHRYVVRAHFTLPSTQRRLSSPDSSAAAVAVTFPQPRTLFLTQPAGHGSVEAADAHARTRCGHVFRPLPDCPLADFLRMGTNWEDIWQDRWSDKGLTMNWAQAVFTNPFDLDAGRRVNCVPRRGNVTLCWASSHHPGNHVGNYTGARSISVILMEGDRAFFGSWHFAGTLFHTKPASSVTSGGKTEYFPPSSEPPWSAQHAEKLYADQAKLENHTAFDGQGRKAIPHVCLSCHGGRFDPTSGHVIGASLLPIVPARVAFETNRFSSHTRAKEEENVRAINQIVLASNPAPAVAAQIQALYGGAVQVPGTRANDAAVPPGWRGNEGIYKQIIEPYCAGCHFAQRGALSFASASDLRTLRDAVQRTVCVDHTMPHSETLFRRFWTEGGAVSLPGLLSTWLGFNTCGP